MSMLWILLTVSLITVSFTILKLYPKIRAATNFNLIFNRALRTEGSKEIAIAEALKHLRTFLSPFSQLSDSHIQNIAQIFADVREPNKAIQPLLQHAVKINNIQPLVEIAHLKSWKQNWLANTEGLK